jgi:hypothetical protein
LALLPPCLVRCHRWSGKQKLRHLLQILFIASLQDGERLAGLQSSARWSWSTMSRRLIMVQVLGTLKHKSSGELDRSSILTLER